MAVLVLLHFRFVRRKRNIANVAVLLLASFVAGCRTVEYRFLPVVILPPIGETVREQPAPSPQPQSVVEETDAQAEAALKASRNAAEQGNVPAQIETGARLRDGRGSDPDVVEAFKWFQIAAKRGDQQA